MCVSFPNFYVDALTPNVTMFENRTCEEVIQVKRGPKSGTLLQ